jgi:ribonuclease HII
MFCGIDEAGRGPVIGPLVVAAVFVEDDEPLRQMGVKDSKKLTPHSREAMFDRIVNVAKYNIVVMSAEQIDEERKEYSMNEIELKMFADSLKDMKVSRVYADCPDVNEVSFSSSLSSMIGGVKVVGEHKADDKYPVVSAASIIAKVTRDRMLKEIADELGEDIGSGYPSDPVTVEFINKWIKENGNPPPHTRRSWETVKRMMTVQRNRKLTDW